MTVFGLEESVFAEWGWGDAAELRRKADRQIATIAVRECLSSACLEVGRSHETIEARIQIVMLDDAPCGPIVIEFPFSALKDALAQQVAFDMLSTEDAAHITATLKECISECAKASLTRKEIDEMGA